MLSTIRAFLVRHRLVLILGAILGVGLLGVNLINYYLSSQAMRRTLVKNELPLTTDNLYSEIQARLIRPIRISSLMAHDTFLHDWLRSGEKSPDRVVRYLRAIQAEYDVASTFVVSAETRRYYHHDGILKEVSRSSGKDDWFFSMSEHPEPYRVDVDRDEAENGQLTIFVNHKIFADGAYYGVTGIGLEAVAIGELVDKYRKRYGRDIYFVNSEGMVTESSHDEFVSSERVRKREGFDQIADEVFSNNRGSITYQRNGEEIYLRHRYIPELDWYLMVEQEASEALAPLRRSLYINLGLSLLIASAVLFVSGYTIHFFQRRLERSARVDDLSGLYNRQFFDAICAQAIRRTNRHGRPLSLMLLDVDGFKELNDSQGHLEGDEILRRVAEAARINRRASDIIGRWGGDEFILLLEDCASDHAERIAEALRNRVRERVTAPDGTRTVTVSIGVAPFVEGDTQGRLLERADAALYAAKNAGRDCAVVGELPEETTA